MTESQNSFQSSTTQATQFEDIRNNSWIFKNFPVLSFLEAVMFTLLRHFFQKKFKKLNLVMWLIVPHPWALWSVQNFGWRLPFWSYFPFFLFLFSFPGGTDFTNWSNCREKWLRSTQLGLYILQFLTAKPSFKIPGMSHRNLNYKLRL